MGLLRFTLRKIKCEFIEPRAPNNFMTTTCRIVVIKNCRLEGVKSFTSIYCLSGLVHKQCFAINDDSIFRTFKRQVCLVVLLFIKQFLRISKCITSLFKRHNSRLSKFSKPRKRQRQQSVSLNKVYMRCVTCR